MLELRRLARATLHSRPDGQLPQVRGPISNSQITRDRKEPPALQAVVRRRPRHYVISRAKVPAAVGGRMGKQIQVGQVCPG